GEIREAVQRFHRELEEIRRNLTDVKQEVRGLRKQIADTQDVETRQGYERRIKEITTRPNIGYQKSVSRLITAMGKYLEDPYRARIFVVENARYSSLMRGLQDADRLLLTEHIRDNLSRLDTATQETARSFLQSAEQLDLLEARSGLNRMFHSALRVFGLD